MKMKKRNLKTIERNYIRTHYPLKAPLTTIRLLFSKNQIGKRLTKCSKISTLQGMAIVKATIQIFCILDMP